MIVVKRKLEKWLPHMVGLIFIALLPVFVFDGLNQRTTYWVYSYFYQLIFVLAAFYINYLIITPYFFFEKRKIYFILLLTLFTILLLTLWQYYHDLILADFLIEDPKKLPESQGPKSKFGLHPRLVDNFFLLMVVFGFSSGMAIIQHLRKNESEQKEIEKARVDSELAFLKNQISPHFFFNSLNSIYALIAINSDEAQKAVEKLAELMRYLIYESNIEIVKLQKEFDFTRNYITLMQQRLTSKVKIDVNIEENPPLTEISPLLFIPFVENAFKHGISYRNESYVSVSLRTEKKCVIFECVNSIPVAKRDQKISDGGVGLENIYKRLELIYGNLAQLQITYSEKEYRVNLVIPLEV